MTVLSDALKEQIFQIYRRQPRVAKLFLFNDIPAAKLENAIASYAYIVDDDEEIILLYDDTLFGSSKEGFLLTSNRLYSKNIADSGFYADVDIIERMVIDIGRLTSSIMVYDSEEMVLNMQVTQASGKAENNAVFHVLNETVRLLRDNAAIGAEGGAGVKAKEPGQLPIQCRGCGAPVVAGVAACEYCGAGY